MLFQTTCIEVLKSLFEKSHQQTISFWVSSKYSALVGLWVQILFSSPASEEVSALFSTLSYGYI